MNAAQAMRGRGAIHVSLASIADMCQIAFTDEGPGIPADVLEQIFTPFFTTKVRGSGLGLPTVRRLIEAHQGTIGIACPAAGGTVVTVQLPGGMTAHVTPEVTKGALDPGACHVMRKPSELHDLEPLLPQAFASSGPRQSPR
jgi:nitrogen-specific signal transduction histidine kinase